MTVPQRQATEPVPLRQAIADLLDLSDERDRYLKRIIAAWREGWLAGHAVGYAAGRHDEGAERDAAWNRIARPIARIDPEFGRKRWTLRGEARTRDTFSRPHPGDYPGRGGAA